MSEPKLYWIKPPNGAQIKAYRAEHECSLVEARKALENEAVKDAWERTRVFGDTEEKVDFLMEAFGFTKGFLGNM